MGCEYFRAKFRFHNEKKSRGGGIMAGEAAFDNEKYITEQTSEIIERVDKFCNKL